MTYLDKGQIWEKGLEEKKRTIFFKKTIIWEQKEEKQPGEKKEIENQKSLGS